MVEQAGRRPETGLRELHAALSAPRKVKRLEAVWRRIGRLQEAYAVAAPHHQIIVQANAQLSSLRCESKRWSPLRTGFAECVLVVESVVVRRPVGWRPFMLINGINVRTCREQHGNDVGRTVPRCPM